MVQAYLLPVALRRPRGLTGVAWNRHYNRIQVLSSLSLARKFKALLRGIIRRLQARASGLPLPNVVAKHPWPYLSAMLSNEDRPNIAVPPKIHVITLNRWAAVGTIGVKLLAAAWPSPPEGTSRRNFSPENRHGSQMRPSKYHMGDSR
jgi:hypothetical protein